MTSNRYHLARILRFWHILCRNKLDYGTSVIPKTKLGLSIILEWGGDFKEAD